MRKLKKFKVTYRDLMKIIVCDIKNMECMVHKCENCPGSDALHIYLQKKFKEYHVDDDITLSVGQYRSYSSANVHCSCRRLP